jgi:hypothetical protein
MLGAMSILSAIAWTCRAPVAGSCGSQLLVRATVPRMSTEESPCKSVARGYKALSPDDRLRIREVMLSLTPPTLEELRTESSHSAACTFPLPPEREKTKLQKSAVRRFFDAGKAPR